jgi:hypothetical protein
MIELEISRKAITKLSFVEASGTRYLALNMEFAALGGVKTRGLIRFIDWRFHLAQTSGRPVYFAPK